MQSRKSYRYDPFGPGGEAFEFEDLNKLRSSGIMDSTDPMSIFKVLNAGQPGHIPMPKVMKAFEVRELCKERSSRILANHERLGHILDRHEPTIQKRWTKKTKHRRLEILLDAWPSMAPGHRPEFAAFRKESQAQRDSGTKFRDHFIWPYINQEDLLKPKSLLLMLSARGRHHPCEFAAADGEAMHFGKVTKALVPVFTNDYVVMLNGVTGSDYGRLVAQDREEVWNWLWTAKQFLPGDGLLILEAQDRVMEFLVRCCEHILHDIPATELLADKYPVLPEPMLRYGIESNGFDSLAVMAEEAPYRVPGRLDFGRIESLLAARASAAEDHLWALREDPSYFSEQMLIYREHRQELVKDADGKPLFLPHEFNVDSFWGAVIGSVLSISHIDLEIFSELRRQAAGLRRLQAKYEGKLSPLKDLPEEYLLAILRFRFSLNHMARNSFLRGLKEIVAASPPMRRFFVCHPAQNVDDYVIAIRPGVKKNDVEKELLWILQTLWEDGHALYFARLPTVIDELERLLRAEPRARELISGFVAGRLGTLSILCECRRQLDLYQPWASGYEIASEERKGSIKPALAAWRESNDRIIDALQCKAMMANYRLAQPLDRRFFYPSEKRRTKETVEALRQAEANLDAFWDKFDKCFHANVGDLSNTALGTLLSQQRTLQRTPEWTPPPEEAKATEPVVTSPADDSIYRPLSTLYFELGGPHAEPRAAAQPKTKAKTRGAPTAAPTPQQPQQQLSDAVSTLTLDEQPTFPVDARALKVFRTLFFHPSVTSTPGEVSWNDFLHAMTSTGFRAEKLYGSVWHFQPSGLDVERSIQFHEPHPVGKIPFRVARGMGRRLARAYGWGGGMFVLRK